VPSELNVVTAGVTTAAKYFSLATNFLCFSLIEILLLVTKSENLGTAAPKGFFLKVEP